MRNFYPLVGDIQFDQISNFTYDGSNNLTRVQYLWQGNVVVTLDLTYDGSNNLTDVTRSIPS